MALKLGHFVVLLVLSWLGDQVGFDHAESECHPRLVLAVTTVIGWKVQPV